jgi:two-component system OmpR family sensor kinase
VSVRRVASWPLRVRLAVLAVVLAACGLLVAGVATHYALERFLIHRVDQQFASAQASLVHLGDADHEPPPGVVGALPSHSYAVVYPGGSSVYFANGSPPSALVQQAAKAPHGYHTMEGYRFDVVSTAIADPDSDVPKNGRLVMAIPLSDVNSTLDRLALLELLVGLAVLAAIALLAYLLVRRELAPLGRIEQTAAAIAAGDLSRRVEEGDPSTEMGSLARSLNEMLAQIERAFEERRRSESRLRQFVADASHELKTPLTSVRGFAELFRRGAADRPEDLALAMSRIEGEAERMGILVDDLLTLARLDQGRPLARDQVDLGALIGELVEDHRLLHPEWPVGAELSSGAEVLGDRVRLRQAFVNMLSNARSHTPPGTPIEARVWNEGDGVAVSIADEGPGIPADVLDSVFERFVRADPSRARSSGGTGLGLAIVEGIVHAHGGRVEAANRPGGGAVFTVWLPHEPPKDTHEVAFRAG